MHAAMCLQTMCSGSASRCRVELHREPCSMRSAAEGPVSIVRPARPGRQHTRRSARPTACRPAAGALKQAQKEQATARATTIDHKIQKRLAGSTAQRGKQVGHASGRRAGSGTLRVNAL